jgi:hypothetical protein
MVVELSVVEQRYHAVMEVVCGGIPVVEVTEGVRAVTDRLQREHLSSGDMLQTNTAVHPLGVLNDTHHG